MNRHRAFTLVELLVVIAIVGVLAALVFPQLDKMRKKANSTECVANLRSLGVAFNLYITEHGTIFPEWKAGRKTSEDEGPTLDMGLAPYIESVAVFMCPADHEGIGKKSGTSYYWNSMLNGQSIGALDLLGITKERSRIPLMMDKQDWHKETPRPVNYLYIDGHVDSKVDL